ncbi:hypothetical protein BDQ17DRAFT_625617 [Cyathus striatus]|nr:hypothetical protein BDQ17DRAFT_625617 [Cyathus striatus]
MTLPGVKAQQHSVGTRPRILFYHKHQPHYGFTNFSPHPIVYEGRRFPTSEHLFQSFKFHKHHPGLSERIRTCSESPRDAFLEARRLQRFIRADWKSVHIRKMDEALLHKFLQHPNLQAELLATGNTELVENSDQDSFWGIGSDGLGRNELGKALERLRINLRFQLNHSQQATSPDIYFCSRHHPYFGFTTFSPHYVDFGGKRYPTAEHLFQSMKFQPSRPDIAELMCTYPGGPREVKTFSQNYRRHVRHDWFEINTKVMENIIRAKFSQYPDLAEELRKTGKSRLIFDSSDDFWGIGSSASGKNEYGKLLEKIRNKNL